MKVPLKTLICTTDFSDLSNHALQFGIALASELSARLYLCHVIDLTPLAFYGEGFSDPLAHERKLTEYAHERLQDLIGDRSIDWEPLILTGHTADEIALIAQDRNADLVISATHARSGLKRFIVGSVTQSLMRTLPCPLLVVRSPEQGHPIPSPEHIRFKRILVACDFSSYSSLAVQYGLSLAQEFQSEVNLIHVIEPAVYKDLLRPAMEAREEYQQDLREELNRKLTEMIPEEAYNWCTPKTTLLAGQPHEELTKYAVVHGVDLIVLGVRGYSLVETLFVGSTTERVVRQAACPVLSVPAG